MADFLVLTGSRPPSARADSRQTHVRPKSGYKKVSASSDADELLFGSSTNAHSHNDLGLYHKFSPAPAQSDVNWAKRVPTPKRDRPLLWAPSSNDAHHRPVIKPALTSLDFSHKNKYRLIKHKPTFVDETLFGPKLEEPSFAAPWEEKNKQPRPFLFSSMDYRNVPHGQEPEPYSVDGRPPSRRSSRPNSTTARPTTVESSSGKKSVWKP